jgi:hypothetical protein
MTSHFLPNRANKNLKITVRHVATNQAVHFTGWVTAFTDAFASDWNETPVYGRMDNLATFKRTGRKIQISFDVVSEDPEDAIQNNYDLGRLARYLYPVYETTKKTSQNVIVAAPVLELSWTNMIMDARENTKGLIGYLRGFTYQPVVEEGMFVANEGANILWKYFTVDLDFTVLHTHLPGWASDSQGERWSYGGAGFKDTTNTPDKPAAPGARGETNADFHTPSIIRFPGGPAYFDPGNANDLADLGERAAMAEELRILQGILGRAAQAERQVRQEAADEEEIARVHGSADLPGRSN